MREREKNDNWTERNSIIFNPQALNLFHKKKLINYFIDLTAFDFYSHLLDNFLKGIFNSINLDFHHYKCEGIKKSGNDVGL